VVCEDKRATQRRVSEFDYLTMNEDPVLSLPISDFPRFVYVAGIYPFAKDPRADRKDKGPPGASSVERRRQQIASYAKSTCRVT